MSGSENDMRQMLRNAAVQLRDCLTIRGQRIVFAESCTGGRVAGELCAIPGISNYLCGSFVVYRNASKASWLGVPLELLDDPARGPVSPEASGELATRALQHTPEADLCVAVTGDLGPGANPKTDGQVYIAGQLCGDIVQQKRVLLPQRYDTSTAPALIRQRRLDSATLAVLEFAASMVSS